MPRQPRKCTPGHAKGYQNGCRCETCRAQWNEYHRNYKRAHGRRPRSEYLAARRMGLTRRRGEAEDAYRQRLAELQANGAQLHVDAYYGGERERPIAIRPTAIGKQILEATQARTGRDPHDIVEHLLRMAGPTLQFDESASASA